jgi:hypothetical protein
MSDPASSEQYDDPLSQQLIDVGRELQRVAMHKEADVCFLAAGFIQGQSSRIKALQARDDYVTGCLV